MSQRLGGVLRGTVHPVRAAALTPMARHPLLADLEIPVVPPGDVYRGKVGAARGDPQASRLGCAAGSV
ncbi:MAG: hypothetical protein H7274_19645 [Rhodoferax sp.]|nr:hypothetical protein [Rhodoferax sp.]